MTVFTYTFSIPVIIQHLNGLNIFLDKPASWAAARKVNETDLLNMRLSPDMFNFARQVRAATDRAARAAFARLAKSRRQAKEFTYRTVVLPSSLVSCHGR